MQRAYKLWHIYLLFTPTTANEHTQTQTRFTSQNCSREKYQPTKRS